MRKNKATKWYQAALACALSVLMVFQVPALALAQEGESLDVSATETAADASSSSSSSNSNSSSSSSEASSDKSVDEAFDKIEEGLNQQMEMALETLSNLNSEAELAEYDLINVQNELATINARIEELDVQIPELEASLAEMRGELAKLIAENYKEGAPTLLDVVVDVTSFEDLISRVDYANRVSEYTSNMVSDTKDLNTQLVQQRNDLEIEKVKQEQLLTEQEQRLAAVEAATASIQSYYDQLDSEMQHMITVKQDATQTENAELAREAAAEAKKLAEEMGNGNMSADQSASYDFGDNQPAPAAYNASAFVANAFTIVGAGYKWSGYTWTGSLRGSSFTCSGVIDFARGRPSRSSSPEILYAEVGSRMVTNTDDLKYGDLVFYSYAGRHPGHVGIYIGGGSIIDSIPNGGVAIRDVNYMPFIGGGPIY